MRLLADAYCALNKAQAAQFKTGVSTNKGTPICKLSASRIGVFSDIPVYHNL
jgi:hypothetical protein